jgi:4-amino-4-deoxy-L-arabinose transferase-like glycosyltransferase
VACAGALLFLLRLGDTGLVDETPPLFAAAARAMAEGGDWLIPHVNGMPRYDKPPLVYWLMALGYALPGHSHWDPLGTWAACLPSALATISVMVGLAQTLQRWPQVPQANSAPLPGRSRVCAPLLASLAFGLGPLTLVWGRSAVSDALFSALLALALLLGWRTYASDGGPWWPAWVVVALAVLTKGPVALVLLLATLLLFAVVQGDRSRLVRRLRPLRGAVLTLALAAPWYLLALGREGAAFWNSFFIYHNAQRFSQVVNNHHQSWWYFGGVMLVASLPFTPLLLLGLAQGLAPLAGAPWLGQQLVGQSPSALGPAPGRQLAPGLSLQRFAACWLLAVLMVFSLAATKLPSYWLPATPAAALLVALAASSAPRGGFRAPGLQADGRGAAAAKHGVGLALAGALAASVLCLLALAGGLAAAPQWVPLIQDPGMPALPAALLAGPWFGVGAGVVLVAALCAARGLAGRLPERLLQSQVVLLLLVPLLLLPLAQVLDQQRGLPLRRLAAEVVRQGQVDEPLAMVGLMKPSLHFYSRRTVIYEGRSATALVNLADRLRREHRPGLQPSTPRERPHLLVVMDGSTARRPYWQGLGGQVLARVEPYELWRLDRQDLEQRSGQLRSSGLDPSWSKPRPERY